MKKLCDNKLFTYTFFDACLHYLKAFDIVKNCDVAVVQMLQKKLITKNRYRILTDFFYQKLIKNMAHS